MLKGFKQFILRGNVIDLAVGVVVGAAFNAVVAAIVKDLISPLLAATVQQPDFSHFAFMVNNTSIPVGDLLNAVISFLIVAATVYFFIVLPVNALNARMHRGTPAEEVVTKKCPECLSDIPKEARRCAHCTSVVK